MTKLSATGCDAVSAMRATYDFKVPKAVLSLAFSRAELALGCAVQLAEQCRELFMVQPLLTAVNVAHGTAGDVPGWLELTFIEAGKQIKVSILLCLDGLLAHSHAGELLQPVCNCHQIGSGVHSQSLTS